MSLPTNTCQYIVPRKNRRCKLLTKQGSKYCGEHLIFDPESKRIPCPKNPNHTVFASRLESHLLICNERLSEDAWIKENFNVPSVDISNEFQRPTEQETSDVCALIQRVYPEIKDQIQELPDCRRHFYDKYIADTVTEKTNEKQIKHLKQLSSIIDHLKAHNLLHDNSESCLIDLGSGKAQLIYWLAKKAPKCRYLLVDKQGTRNKYDNKAVAENQDLKVTRVRCCIQHLDLSELDVVKECSLSITAICKHFCGNAMDTGIRCIENAIKQGVKFNGFCFASCCHHRCTQEEFIGIDYLNSIGIQTDGEFSAIRHISTWATCRFLDSDSTEQATLNAEKLELGRRAKHILELARAKHLSKLGYKVELFKYVDFEISPENLLIVGSLKGGEGDE